MRILFIILIVLMGSNLLAQSTIADARRENEGTTVSISGIITNGDELGVIKYIQDSSAGIALYDDKVANIKRGDSVSVVGKLSDYNNLLEVTNISSVTIHSSGNALPAAKTISISQLGEDYESQLIRINKIEFTDGGGTFGGDNNYEFTDGTKTGIIRISKNSPIVGQPIPSGKISVIALCSQYSRDNNDSRNGYQILPRNLSDFISESSVNITSSVSVSNIGKNTLSLDWNTDVAADPFVRYGNSNKISDLTNTIPGNSSGSGENNYKADINGLEPAEIIYVQAFNVLGSDTAFSAISAYVAESNSTGTINVYFNSQVSETVATQTIAKNIGNAMEDTLANYINRASESIDLCIYNFDNNTISNALNTAYNRGVTIRLITCGSTNHYSVNDLNSNIQVLERPEIAEGGIMHNKFAVIDVNANDAGKPWVWSGSTNLTDGQLYSDANNMIFIQDRALAKTYKIEFEEMWGSTSNSPDASQAKFGDQKTNNTPHELLIGGKRVECYFSPSDNTNQKLIDAMATADKDLNVQTMLITRTDLANAIIDAANRAVDVNVICNDKNDNSDYVNDILGNLPSDKYIFDFNASGILHHKMAIIDARFETSDPLVISGSHNWSNAANTKNDENTLIIHNADIANQYYQQFAYRFEQNGGDYAVSASVISFDKLRIFPNPTTNSIQISTNQIIRSIQIYSISGTLIQTIIPAELSKIDIDLSQQKSGIYLLKVESEQKQINTYKVIKYE